MKTLLVCLLFVNFCVAGKDISWFYGTVILRNQEVLTGNVSVDPVQDLVLFQSPDNLVQVYSPHKVTSVFFYDPGLDLNRKFVTVPALGQAMRPSLFEVVVNGEISVLRKQSKNSFGRVLSDRDDFEYFTRIGSQMTPLKSFSRSVFPLIEAQTVVRDFIRINNLNVFELPDAIRIIMHYNQKIGTGLAITRR